MSFNQDTHLELSAKGGKHSQARRDSLTSIVAAEVTARGMATLDDLEVAFPDKPRAKLKSALYNARFTRLVMVVGSGNSRNCAVWGPWEEPDDGPRIDPTTLPRPVSSVWELGDRARAEQFDQRSRALDQLEVTK